MEYYSFIKTNVILPLAKTQMDLEGIVNWNKSDKDKYCMISFTCGILKSRFFLKKNKLLDIPKEKQTHRYREVTMVPVGWGRIRRYKLLGVR